MLALIVVLGLAIIVGGVLIGATFGIALFLLGLFIKVAVIGLVAYLIIRIVSPRTAAALRARFSNRSTLPRF
jgi:hypothetical protein